MREAAADLNFEEAARLRDEVKRLRATELAVVDDPTAKQRVVQGKAGAYAGAKKYGASANLPESESRGANKYGGKRGSSSPSPLAGEGRGGGSAGGSASRVHKPDLDEMGIATWHEVKPARPKRAGPRKPTLDEMGPGTESKIYRPTSTREANTLGPSPRSSGGAPGHRGGWKKR